MQREDQTIDALHQTLWKFGAHGLQLALEFCDTFATRMLIDDELGKRLIGDAHVILDFGGDFGDERQKLEVGEIVHGCRAASRKGDAMRRRGGYQKFMQGWLAVGDDLALTN